ncbi:MAG: fasciclin domain-containing protein [Paracoccaceae bacterium]|nr:fasciclin domain-containing protein [Paracoccaceae bacterium]
MHHDKNIVGVAEHVGGFSTLIAAIKAAGLEETLEGNGPFTVFAPTDEAFANLPAGTVENLLKPENKDQLVAILTYHVVPGKVLAADVVGNKLSPATVQGSTLSVDGTDGVKVNDANVVKADVLAKNGVIHVVDSVLLPK